MKDDAVDEALRTLRETLAVEPSPEFEARVRARLAARRPAGRPVRAWLLAAAAVVLLALALVGRVPRETTPVPLVRATPPPATLEPAPRIDAVRVARAASTRRRRAVLVPPDGMARLARYVAAVRDHPLRADQIAASDARVQLADPPALAVPAIQITPLEISEGRFE